MGTLQDSDRDAPAAVESASPGQRLRIAREARQLTRDAVAVQMRIEAKVIDALERDDYTQLPAAVFVRGYIRAYAKLVGLAAEPLVDAFDQRTAQAPPRLVLPAAIGPDIESRSGYARWIVFALALLSLLLFYQWWHMEGSKPTPVAAVPPAAAPPQTATPTPTTESIAATPATVPTPELGTPLENLYDSPADESGLGEVTALPPASAVAANVAPVTVAAAPATNPANAPSAANSLNTPVVNCQRLAPRVRNTALSRWRSSCVD